MNNQTVNRVKYRIVASTNPYRVGDAIALWWGRNEQNEPQFLAGNVTEVDVADVVVRLNNGDSYTVPEKDWKTVVLLKKNPNTTAFLTKQQARV